MIKGDEENLRAHDPGLLGRQAQNQNRSAAWSLLMRELNKINDQYGSDVLEEQLLQAEANRWQSITLKNYEQFGVKHGSPPRPITRA